MVNLVSEEKALFQSERKYVRWPYAGRGHKTGSQFEGSAHASNSINLFPAQTPAGGCSVPQHTHKEKKTPAYDHKASANNLHVVF